MTLAELDLKPAQTAILQEASRDHSIYLFERDPDVEELVAMGLLRTFPYYRAGKRCFALTREGREFFPNPRLTSIV
jgi:hypothetical protein